MIKLNSNNNWNNLNNFKLDHLLKYGNCSHIISITYLLSTCENKENQTLATSCLSYLQPPFWTYYKVHKNLPIGIFARASIWQRIALLQYHEWMTLVNTINSNKILLNGNVTIQKWQGLVPTIIYWFFIAFQLSTCI